MRMQRNPELAWREVGGETIVIHLGRKMMYGLNPAGGRVWAALEEPVFLEDLQASIPAEVGAEESVHAAVRAFVADLAAEGLVVVDPPLEEDATSPDADLGGAHLPRIAWRDEIRRFAGACAKYPGLSQICEQNPFNS